MISLERSLFLPAKYAANANVMGRKISAKSKTFPVNAVSLENHARDLLKQGNQSGGKDAKKESGSG